MTDKPAVSLDEAKLILRVPHSVFDKLFQTSTHYGFKSLEDYCVARLVESMETKIGAPHIGGPSTLNGNQAPMKTITGPSGSGMVTRG